TAPSRASFRIRGQLERHPLLRPSNAVPRELHPPPRAAPLVRLGKRCRMVLFRGFGEGGRVSSQRSAISDQRSAVSGQQSAVSSQQSAVSSQQSAFGGPVVGSGGGSNVFQILGLAAKSCVHC